MKKLNQQGMGAVEIVLILVLAGILGFTGWYVWHSKQGTDKSLTNAGNSQYAQPATAKTITQSKNATKYLVIKEWDVKIPLGTDSDGFYYYLRPATQGDPARYVDILSTRIDKLKNKDGDKCGDPTFPGDTGFPIFVIGRVKVGELNQVTYTDKGSYSKVSFSKDYEFSGQVSHQSAPPCSSLNNDSLDQNISNSYADAEQAFTSNYKNLQSQ